MSLVQRWTLQREEKLHVVKSIAVEAGVLVRCRAHEDEIFFHTLQRRPAAIELANFKFSHCQLPNIFENRRDLMNSLRHVITNAPLECRCCAGGTAASSTRLN